jgi:hypothetical protein
MSQAGRVQIHDANDAVVEVLIEIKPTRRRALAAEANGRIIAFGRNMSACKSEVENIVRRTPEWLLRRRVLQ